MHDVGPSDLARVRMLEPVRLGMILKCSESDNRQRIPGGDMLRAVSTYGGSILRKSGALAAIWALCGCTTDITNDQQYHDVVRRCLETAVNTAFVQRGCASPKTDQAGCYSLVELPAPEFPSTDAEYRLNPAEWDRRIAVALSYNYRYFLNGGTRVTREPDPTVQLEGFVPARTRLELARVVSENSFEDSTVRREAVFLDGPFQGRHFTIPQSLSYGDRGWLVIDDTPSMPGSGQFRENPEHLQRCDVSK